MLERVGLGDREYFYPRQLSGGQAQRVAIARALVNNPHILIADEPTGNLDSASSRLVMELLSEIHQAGSTILMVTHNPELTRYASRVVFMHDGSIISDEKSAIGQVSEVVRKSMYSLPKMTEDDTLAGISTIMHTFPQEQSRPKKVVKAKSTMRRVKTSKKRGKK